MIGERAASLERLGESAGDDMVDARPSPDYESVSVSRERAAQLFGQKQIGGGRPDIRPVRSD
jgi:hypothetical protein